MKKTEDPYKEMLHLFGGIAKTNAIQSGAGLGKVISPPPSIQVAFNGMVLDARDLWVNDYWIPGHTRHIVGATSYRGGGSGDPAYESHNHPIDNDETWTDTWAVGDYVALVPLYTTEDPTRGQQYLVFGKWRRLDD